MSDLIHHPNVVVTHDPYHTWHAYYLLPPGANSLLDISAGKTFGVVETPVSYTTNKHYGKWTYAIWEMATHQYKHDTEPQRYYRVQKVRELTDEERAYYESITPAPLPRPVKEREETTC